jgi:hypothetical protein
MTSRKAILFFVVLMALPLAAYTAPNASGQRVYTCHETGIKNGDFEDAHCKESGPPGSSDYAHVLVTQKTESSTSNINTGAVRSTAKLKSVQSGVTLELQATNVSGSGTIENHEEGATTWVTGSTVGVFEGVTVTAPAGKGCEVEGGKVTTNKLSMTSKGLTNELKYTPAEGETFAEFTIKGCAIGALNHVYAVKGSLKATMTGATVVSSHEVVTIENSVFVNGQKAGITNTLTIKGENGDALVLT